jgi:uncharacterized protein YabN with tetrapyrrole methylase and pyrophosphatase domain
VKFNFSPQKEITACLRLGKNQRSWRYQCMAEVSIESCPARFTRALKPQGKAAKLGFNWPSVENAYDKITEEIAELREATDADKAGECGDVLYALANVARHLWIDPEAALRITNEKFICGFG